MMRVIINADDLGMSEDVNETIFYLMSKGIVTSATIMANGPSVESAIKGSKCFPSCSFGAHLNLTEFRPLTENNALSELLTPQGQFSRALDTSPKQIKKSHALLNAIAEEWSCQIDFLRNHGVPVSHLDSHQHVHVIPFVFPALKYVQVKYKIRKVRLTTNIYQRATHASAQKRLAKFLFNFCLKHMYSTITTEAFLDFVAFHERAIVGGERWESVEVMVHPGSKEAREENALLESCLDMIIAADMRLISYSEL